MKIPDGWTDDMRVPLPPGKTVDDLVDYVIDAALANTSIEDIETELGRTFELGVDDAAVARDRVFGGIFRAGTTAPENQPNQEKDPLAWASYNRAKANPEIITAIFPEFSRANSSLE